MITIPTGLPPAWEKVVEDVILELDRATSKFGSFNSSHEGYAVMKEEFDEMWDEIKRNDIQRSREECVQVAAMAFRYLIDIDYRK